MIVKLKIKNIETDKEEVMANYITYMIDAFMDVVRKIDDLEEYDEEEES